MAPNCERTQQTLQLSTESGNGRMHDKCRWTPTNAQSCTSAEQADLQTTRSWVVRFRPPTLKKILESTSVATWISKDNAQYRANKSNHKSVDSSNARTRGVLIPLNTIARQLLEIAVQVGSPTQVRDIDKIIPVHRNKGYCRRQKELKLLPQEQRKLIEQLIRPSKP